MPADPERFVEGVREVKRLLLQVAAAARWPMYIRNVKQLVRSVDPTFDERKYGFSGFNELLRACAKDGLLRLERGRQGVLRVLPGAALQAAQAAAAAAPAAETEPPIDTAAPGEMVEPAEAGELPESPADADAEAAEGEAPKKRRRTRGASGRKTASGARKTASRKPRAKKATPPAAE